MKRPFTATAPHIRGLVFTRGGITYMQVINVRTGKVLASDNTGGGPQGLAVMTDLCHAAVAAARGAWTFNYRRSDLR